MAIDPSISLGVRPPVIPPLQIQTPLEKFAKIQTLRNLMGQGQMRQLEMQKTQLETEALQRSAQDEQNLGSWMRQNQQRQDITPQEIVAAHPNPTGIKFATALSAQQTAALTQHKAVLDAAHEEAKTDDRIYNSVVDDTSKMAALAELVRLKRIDGTMASHLTAIPFDSPEFKGIQQRATAQSLDRLQRIEAAKKEIDLRIARTTESSVTQKAMDEAKKAKQEVEGTQPITKYQQAQIDVSKVGKTEPKPQSVIDQEIAIEKAKEITKADPFGLFAGTTGATTTGTPAAGVTPTPLAQAIATFEGFDKAGSVAQKNNNPGNLRAGPGQTGTDKNGYAIFPDLNTGWSALHDLIQKRSGDNLTLQEFFGGKKGVYPGYAPAADQNDPANYAATVAKTLGVEATAKLADIPGSLPAAAKPGARITPDMQGQAVIDALPGPVAQMVKGYAEGRLTFPTGRALMSPFMQQMLGLVGQYDPSFDVNNPGKRAATAKAFAVGKEGQQINALNTAIGHVDDLSKSADKLDNTWSPAYNTIANLISKQMGRPAVNNFDTTKKAVVDELTRVWRGTGGSEADIKSWSQSLDAANSPEQLHGAIATIGRLLESKLGALEDQYREGMGTISQGRHMITPDARKTLDRLEQKAGNTPSTAKAGPAVGSVEGGYRFKGGDPSKPENWEKQ